MLSRLPPLPCLRAFEAVVRHRSVTRAAAELGVTQPAISQRLRQLEAFMGRPLVRRDAGGVAITNDGKAYGVRLERAFAEIHAATEELRTVGDAGRALTISVLATFAQRWLIPRLAGFQAAHPEIEIRLLATSQIADLWREDVDLSIRPGARKRARARSDFLIANDLFPVAAPALLERQPVRAAADLAAQVLLRVEAAPRDQDWPRWLAAAGVPQLQPRSWLPFASSSHALEAAIAGLGVAIGHTPFVVDALDAGRLVAPLEHRIADDGYYLVATRDQADSRKVRSFRSWLLAEHRGGANGSR
jgi:LysR family transcriptional regulator, glycine cleavage system transcriptional activator